MNRKEIAQLEPMTEKEAFVEVMTGPNPAKIWRDESIKFARLCDEKDAEIERLRTALEFCAKDTYFDEWDLEFILTPVAKHARAALDHE